MSAPRDVFLSYSHNDLAAARRFAEAFEREGLTVWWDAALRSGEAFDSVIEAALEAAKAVVVLWSATSVQSRWVRQHEWRQGAGSFSDGLAVPPQGRLIPTEAA